MDIGVGSSGGSPVKDKSAEDAKKSSTDEAMEVDKDGESVIKISAVSGANDDSIQIAADDDDDAGGSGLQIKSVEGSSTLKITSVSGATTANGSAQTADVVELDDDDSSQEGSKKDGDPAKV